MIFMGPSRRKNPDEKLDFKKVLASFSSLPRVLRLVWSASAWLTAGLAICTILSGITPVASVTIAGFLLNSVVKAIATQSFTPIWLPVILQLGVGLLNLLLSTVNNIMQQLLQERVSNQVQFMVLEKANTLDLAFFENPAFYDKLRVATNEATYRPMNMISQVFGMGQSLITLLSMLGLLFTLQWWLVLIALVIPIPSFIANTIYGMRGYRLALHQSPERRQMMYYSNVMTTDDYNKEIKLFNLSDFFIRRYRKLAQTLYEQDRKLVTRRGIIGSLWSALAVISNSGIYLYVAFQAVSGHINLGQVTQFTMATTQAGQNFQSLLNSVSSTYENNLYINTLFELLEYQPDIVSPEDPVPVPVVPGVKGLDVEFRNVSFTYPQNAREDAAEQKKEVLAVIASAKAGAASGDERQLSAAKGFVAGKRPPALKNVSFTIRAGESIALVGRNGAGKTTLVKLLTRLYDPDEGEILIGGRNIKEYKLEELREQVGVIFQDFKHYHMVARENIGLGRVGEIENQPLIESSARKSGADEVIDRLPNRYETMLGRWFRGLGDEGTQLSGGEWQKVALSRAFMRDAPILVLDEPTSALDAQAEYDVFRRFRDLTEGKTALFISHRFSTVRLADRIFVIEHGQLIEDGSHAELLALDGRYAELFNLQAEAYR